VRALAGPRPRGLWLGKVQCKLGLK
jgi:hypothetical protein